MELDGLLCGPAHRCLIPRRSFFPLTLLPSDNPPRVLGQLQNNCTHDFSLEKGTSCCVRGVRGLRNDFVTLSSCITAKHHRSLNSLQTLISSQMSWMCCARAIASSRSLAIKKIYNFHEFIGCVSLSEGSESLLRGLVPDL